MNKELEQFNINIDDIKESNDLISNIQEAIDKLRINTLADRFEVVLNNNLIESKEKLTNFRTILGCRITYDNLDKNISFIVREDNKISYEELEQKLYKYKEVLDKIKEIFKDYGVKEDIVTYSMYRITGEEVYKILELLEEIE